MFKNPAGNPTHYHDLDFASYLYSTLLQLEKPLDAIRDLRNQQLKQSQKPLLESQAIDFLFYDLSIMFWSFFRIDQEISLEESRLYSDFRTLFRESMTFDFDQASEAASKLVNEKSNWYIDLVSPTIIANYDRLYGTNYRDILNALLFRVATLVVKSDGLPSFSAG